MTKAFLSRNGLELLVRSHEVKEEGYEVEHNGLLVRGWGGVGVGEGGAG